MRLHVNLSLSMAYNTEQCTNSKISMLFKMVHTNTLLSFCFVLCIILDITKF